MERATVIGASGFIGRALVAGLLREGFRVEVVVRRRGPWLEPLDVAAVHIADVTDPESLRGILQGADVVYHLAGATLARGYARYHRVNVLGSKHVAGACAAADSAPRLQFVSSLAAVGPTVPHQPLAETATPRPVSHYGRSKLAAEQELRSWQNRVSIQIVRPPSVMGPGDPYLLQAFRWAARGWVVIPGRTEHRYSFVHIDDLCGILIAVAVAGQSLGPQSREQGVYHAAQAPAFRFGELGEIVAETLERPAPRVVRLPDWLSRGVGYLGEAADRITFRRPVLNADKMREGLAGSWICDAAKLQHERLYRFPESLEQRIRQTVDDYQAAGKLF